MQCRAPAEIPDQRRGLQIPSREFSTSAKMRVSILGSPAAAMRCLSPIAPMRLAPALATRTAASPAMLDAASVLANPAEDPVAAAFEFVTLVPQPLWLLLIFLPKWSGTRALFRPIGPLALLAFAHLFIVVMSTQGGPDETAPLDLFNKLFDAREDGLATYLKLGSYRNFAAEEAPPPSPPPPSPRPHLHRRHRRSGRTSSSGTSSLVATYGLTASSGASSRRIRCCSRT